MKLVVVILCYKVPDLTIDCLRSIDGVRDEVPDLRVVVCENGTGGDAPEQLARAIEENAWGDWCELMVVHPNRGFCGGNNLVMEQVLAWDDPPEYLLLLNADTLVEPGSFSQLVAFMDAHPRAGIAGSRLLAPDGQVQASPFRFPSVFSEFDRGLNLGAVSRLLRPWSVVLTPPDEPCRADWVAGASMIIRRTMLDEIGLLDGDLYTYFDDIDIGLRARRAGWETWYVPASRVVHLEGASTGVGTRHVKRLPSYWFQARRRCYLRHYGPFYTAMADGAYLLGSALAKVRRWVQRRPDTGPPHLLADSLHHSVFRAGFAVRPVENPALREGDAARQGSAAS